VADRPTEPTPSTPSEFRLVKQTVHDLRRKAIFDGTYPPGSRVVEAEIARRFRISRAPVREALRQLQESGLVAHEPRRGWFVTDLTSEDLWDIYQMRAFAEGLAVRRLAHKMTPELLARLNGLIEQMAAAAAQGHLDELAAYNVRFHEHIVREGGSGHLHRMWALLHPQDWTIITVTRLTDVPPAEIAQRHHLVVDALVSGDPDLARRIVPPITASGGPK
jgi:DNA-binding GntR family transcriptional regulator